MVLNLQDSLVEELDQIILSPDVTLQIWSLSNILPSQRNMSQMRSTEAHGSVREKAHMNHSVMYRMGSRLCFWRWRWAVGDTLCSRADRISPSSWMASCGGGGEQQSEQTPVTSFKPLRPSFKPSQQLESLRHLPPVTCSGWQESRKTHPKHAVLWAFLQHSTWISSAEWNAGSAEQWLTPCVCWGCTDPYQPCAVVTRQVLLTDLDQNPEGILGHRKETKCNKWTNTRHLATQLP